MKKLIILSLLSIGVFSYSQTSAGSDIPSVDITPYHLSEDAELEAKGYSKSPKSYPTEKPYVTDYTNNTRKIVENIDTRKIVPSENDDTMSKIINSSNNKIDINGGYVDVRDAFDLQNDGTYKPKYDVYKPDINNEEYNQTLKTQEQIQTYKAVKKEAKDILPIILSVLLIIASIYLILLFRKRLKY